MQDVAIAHETGPFGPPDGARAELDDYFVDFSGQPSLEDLASSPSDRSARVIVGKKGVGKTLYLRRFQDNAKKEKSIYTAGGRESEVPATEDVIRICDLYPVELASEAWEWIWRRAIMQALVSHILCEPSLRHLVFRQDPDLLDTLEKEAAALFRKAKKPHGVYVEAQTIIGEVATRERLARDLRKPEWADLEETLSDILPHLPPICFYLDSVDEKFGSAPLYWLQCQLGLLKQVLRLLDDARFGNRLHVVVSIRDLVRSSLVRGEHAMRYRRAPYIRVLDWDHSAIRYFLHAKIARLARSRPELLMKPDESGVRGWLGRDRLYNPARGVYEQLEDYLLRHTRLIPRDVVQLGNRLAEEIAAAKTSRQDALDDNAIRAAVSEVAKEFAEEQIAVCTNHIVSDITPRHAERDDTSDFFTSNLYARGVGDELSNFMSAVGTDRFPLATLMEALNAAGPYLRTHPNPLDVLWQNGLLGYDPKDPGQRHSHFYGAHDVADFQLPLDLDCYVFHPVLAHKVSITAAGDRPVQGFK